MKRRSRKYELRPVDEHRKKKKGRRMNSSLPVEEPSEVPPPLPALDYIIGMRATVSLLNCCDVPPSHHPSMNGQMLFESCHFLPLPPAPTYRDALTSSCSDLIETVLALHSNTLVCFPFISGS
ncbi:unnamed protein product [Caenorhabditis brenneri]